MIVFADLPSLYVLSFGEFFWLPGLRFFIRLNSKVTVIGLTGNSRKMERFSL